MYHSITFGIKNTWDDWKLIPSSRPVFNPPSFKSSYINVPGVDGFLDLSTTLSNKPLYGNRTGSFEFIVYDQETRWEELYANIANYLHGQQLWAVLEDDAGYYYDGRFIVNQWKSDPDYSKIVIDYVVQPFKLRFEPIGEDWLWDPFSFEDDIITDYNNLTVDGTLTITIPGSPKASVPTLTVSENMTVTYKNQVHTLKKGINKVPEIRLVSGDNTLIFTGNGNLTIRSYRRGSL